jgi:hypothetical protein
MAQLSDTGRFKFALALVALVAFCVLCGAGLGVSIHGIAETGDSLDHWRAQAEEPAPETTLSMDRPAARIERLEAELASHQERAAVCGGMLLFFAALTALGVRTWRQRT